MFKKNYLHFGGDLAGVLATVALGVDLALVEHHRVTGLLRLLLQHRGGGGTRAHAGQAVEGRRLGALHVEGQRLHRLKLSHHFVHHMLRLSPA